MALKLLRTLRLDGSDEVVFERAAGSSEVAVPGTFQFFGVDPEQLSGKRRQAFNAAFLGLGTFGHATLAVVATVSDEERLAATGSLASHLRAFWGAPDETVALAAAEEEIAFSADLARHPVGTVVALARRFEGGEIRERFRTLERVAAAPEDFNKAMFRAITAVPDEPTRDTADDDVDLAALARRPS